MDKQSRIAMTEQYSNLLEIHGATPEAIVYQCPEQQIARYNLMADVEPIAANSSIMDVGCGLGYFGEYLRKYGWKGSYTGLDINPDMIEAARKRLPQEEFVCVDILSEEFEQHSDYVFCGATIQHRPKYVDPKKYLEQMVAKMFSLADRALVFDVFSGRADYYDDDKLYANPGELLEFCYTLTGRVVVRNDCRPYELMVYLFKDERANDLNIYSSWSQRSPRIV